MSMLGSAGKAVGGMVKGVGKMLVPTKRDKTTTPSQRHFLKESPEEYADYLRKRKNRGY